MRSRDKQAQRAAKEALRQGIQELGPDFEDEQDLEHMYARDLFEHEQGRAQQQGQQR
mgnify:FL=1